MEEVHPAHEIADGAVGGAGVHGQGAADGGGNAHQRPEIEGGRLADQRRQAHAGPRHRLLAVELRAAQAAFQLEHHAADAAVLDHQVVAAPDDGHRQLLELGEHQRMADVVHVLGDNEDVGEAADAQ